MAIPAESFADHLSHAMGLFLEGHATNLSLRGSFAQTIHALWLSWRTGRCKRPLCLACHSTRTCFNMDRRATADQQIGSLCMAKPTERDRKTVARGQMPRARQNLLGGKSSDGQDMCLSYKVWKRDSFGNPTHSNLYSYRLAAICSSCLGSRSMTLSLPSGLALPCSMRTTMAQVSRLHLLHSLATADP